jgi:hypothetical protein
MKQHCIHRTTNYNLREKHVQSVSEQGPEGNIGTYRGK